MVFRKTYLDAYGVIVYTCSIAGGMNMPNIKTAISIEESIFQQANSLSREMKISRSKLFSLAVRDFIAKQENIELLHRINQAHQDDNTNENDLIPRVKLKQRKILEGTW
jgi:hypothetical protein